MNKDNVQAAINIMKRAGQVNMKSYQSKRSKRDSDHFVCAWGSYAVDTEEEMHKCGNAACFAGWIAVSPEFREAGGTQYEGAPTLDPEVNDVGHSAIAEWLGISDFLARCFVHGNRETMGVGQFSRFYGKDWDQVGKADVIAKLEELLAGELE